MNHFNLKKLDSKFLSTFGFSADFTHFIVFLCFPPPQECTKHRMFNGTYPSTLLINHYDNMEDINRRKHRLKMKVKGVSHEKKKKNSNQLLVVTSAIVFESVCLSTDTREH